MKHAPCLFAIVLALALVACNASPTVMPPTPTFAPPPAPPIATKPTLPPPIKPAIATDTPATKPTLPPPPSKPGIAPIVSPTPIATTASTLNPNPGLRRPANPQIGLNFIRFYWSDKPGALDTTTPHLQPDAIFREFKDLGVQTYRQFVKADLFWDVVEPRDNQWNFAQADSVITNPDFEPLVTLFRMQYASPTPPWASSPQQFQKKMGVEATDYVETVVKRYAPYV
ncbi:MAG: hypothetical protein L0Y55_12575, partial [Anaerolineales bacterium]|nr:hypothetical protein [Anaerolineales bacterium]